ncbi:MAG TPA: CCC motif membrane protein [Ferruginibacter sp.]|nr:CCC motif membrane protein [Ferruginibacter sp.]
MNEQNKDYQNRSNINVNAAPLPNATATLVLGILSIVVCFICGIIALVISNKDVSMYRANPELYSEASYNNIRAGRICSIIGIALQVVGLIFYLVVIVFAVTTATQFN